MSGNGQPGQNSAAPLLSPPARGEGQGEGKLDWTGRVLSAEDVRSRLNGQTEVVLRADTIITPSATDELRRKGIRIVRQNHENQRRPAGRWAYAQDRDYPMITSVTEAAKREGLDLEALQIGDRVPACRWARALAETIGRGHSRGVLAFCEDASMVCCIANKVKGVRAVVAAGITQCSRATTALGANIVGIEAAGRTFFELKQLVRLICGAEQQACSGELARVIEELEGHAHR
jgi:ribose 5-phosphate isomerase RpiB